MTALKSLATCGLFKVAAPPLNLIMQLTDKKRKVLVYSILASGLYLAESFVPYPFPGVRLGMANSITLLALVSDGFFFALPVLVIRLLAAGIFTGSLFGPGFILSASGGFAGLAVMAVLRKFQKAAGIEIFSIYGLSIAGASVHNFTQYLIVYMFFFNVPQMAFYLPILAVSGIMSGIVTAKTALLISEIEYFKKE